MDPLLNLGPGHVPGSALSNESSTSAVSWAAILAGAFVAASATVLLVALGTGLGFASVSPWPNSGASVTTFTAATAIWFIVTQWVASGAGGYITGRLRTRWVGTHTHEVFFRDTAHGFVTWAVATVIGALVLASAASSIAGAGVHAAATLASGAAQGTMAQAQNGPALGGGGPMGSAMNGSIVSPYDVDMLFRSATPDANSSPNDARAETARILAKGLPTGDVSAADRSYVSQLVAARTGISQADAQKRVDDVVAQLNVAQTKARQVADAARKAAAAAAICTALAMLIGAFIACIAAALGGHERDEHA
jgi:hypothetical protein